jgi:adenine-specific DNA methylase
VSKVSKESYKERKANNGQTLTGLGKWWGRKPLVLVRAAILGCLMPASENPKRDMDIFLKIMGMDNKGMELRKEKSFSVAEMYDRVEKDKKLLVHIEEWFDTSGNKLKLNSGVDKKQVELAIFNTLGYDGKLAKCIRPEKLSNLDEQTWNEINHHLGTSAHSLQELVGQLSLKRYGQHMIVGDCFCGGGSIPFEAARMGCDTYASDLNPIAGLLTWASIHICGASEDELAEIKKFQQDVFQQVDREITDLGIEHNEHGDRAVSYLYCVEAHCPECGVKVPLSPSWVIGKGTKTVAQLEKSGEQYNLIIKMGASAEEMKEAERAGTVGSSGLICPSCGKTTPVSSLRRDRKDEHGHIVYGLRRWDKEEFDFRGEDIYSERLYAIKYERADGKRYYRHPNERDLENEQKVKSIVAENIHAWQEKGLVPSMEIESGPKTDEPIRNRGWTHWNHLHNARQLLNLSRFVERVGKAENKLLRVTGLLGLHKCTDWNTRLCRWNAGVGNEKSEQTFYNQAFNTMMNYGNRSLEGVSTSWFYDINNCFNNKDNAEIKLTDTRNVTAKSHLWITDPPYADAVNYHELSEVFSGMGQIIASANFSGLVHR